MLSSIIKRSDLKLKRIDLSWNNISNVSHDLVVSAVCRLEEVTLYYDSSSAVYQFENLLQEISQHNDLKLRRINFCQSEGFTVSNLILGSSICRLEDKDIHWKTFSSYGQYTLPDSQIDCCELKIKNINLSVVFLPAVSTGIYKMENIDTSEAVLRKNPDAFGTVLFKDLKLLKHTDIQRKCKEAPDALVSKVRRFEDIHLRFTTVAF